MSVQERTLKKLKETAFKIIEKSNAILMKRVSSVTPLPYENKDDLTPVTEVI